MNQDLLTINSGSSSIKFAIYTFQRGRTDITIRVNGQFTGIGDDPHLVIRDKTGKTLLTRQFSSTYQHEQLLGELLQWIESRNDNWSLAAAGHRIVHGGETFTTPVLLDDSVIRQLEELVPLAPLHQPHNLAAVQALSGLSPGMPQVACFDTAFHRTQPVVATTFALPRGLTEEGVHRYGFHGLSYEYIAGVLPEYLGAGAGGKVIVAHLGHGASMCAMMERQSVATTMGFTALDGLPMGKRCGSLDPGVVLYLMREKGMDYDALSDLLYKRSGLLGVSGISDDMRELLDSKAAAAKEAVDLFVYHIVRETGSLAAALGGLDALVFTGGIGEHAAPVRENVCRQLGWLGVCINNSANAADERRINTADSEIDVLVIPTDEDLVLAQHTLEILASSHR